MSVLTFEGLSTTFKALANVSFTYFSHTYSLFVMCTKVTNKMFSSNSKGVRHTCNCIAQGLEMYGQGLHKLPTYSIM